MVSYEVNPATANKSLDRIRLIEPFVFEWPNASAVLDDEVVVAIAEFGEVVRRIADDTMKMLDNLAKAGHLAIELHGQVDQEVASMWRSPACLARELAEHPGRHLVTD